jgi:hypothetical protein
VALVLAIASDFRRCDALRQFADDLPGHEVVVSRSLDEALDVISQHIPDLIVFSIAGEAVVELSIARHLATLGAGDPQTLAIPLWFAARGDAPVDTASWFYWYKPQGETARAALSDPSAFAAAIRACLASPMIDAGDDVATLGRTRLRLLRTGRAITFLLAVRRATSVQFSAVVARLTHTSEWLPSVVFRIWHRILSVAHARRPTLRVSRERVAPLGEKWRQGGRLHRSIGVAGLFVAAIAIVMLVTGGSARSTSKAGPTRQPAARREPAPVIKLAGGTKTERKPTGRLRVLSDPEGASVMVGGRKRGVTPLMLDDLPSGRHTVMLESAAGTIHKTIDVRPNQTATLVTSIYSGWLALFAPIELDILEGGRALRADEQQRVMLTAGRHQLQFINRSLGFAESREIEVKPGEVTRVSIVLPKTTLTVIAAPPAEVWMDGAHVGAVPLIDLPVDLGTHDVVVRDQASGDRRRTITARVTPNRVEFD